VLYFTFASNGYSTSNGINPLPVLNEAFSSSKAQQTFADIGALYLEWLQANNNLFASIADGNLKTELPIFVGFEFFGSDNDKWNKGIAFDRWG